MLFYEKKSTYNLRKITYMVSKFARKQLIKVVHLIFGRKQSPKKKQGSF